MQTKSSTIETPSIHSPLELTEFCGDRRGQSARQSSDWKGFQSALACIDDASHGSTVFRHTKAIADGLQIPVKIVHVLQGADRQSSPSDPIQWQLQYREFRDQLRSMLGDEDEDMVTSDQFLSNGLVDNELARWSLENEGSLMATTTRRNSITNLGRADHHLGGTAQKLLESSAASMLFIPPNADEKGAVRYQRIVIPLDGSCRAESILPIAIRIARHHGAELILVHVVPNPEIVESSSYDEEAQDLMKRMRQYSEQNARTYLNRLKVRLYDDSVSMKVVISSDGDPRDRLLTIADNQRADLIVMSARGRSGMKDISCGNIARHLATHSRIPLLMIRQQAPEFRNPVILPNQSRGPRLFRESAH